MAGSRCAHIDAVKTVKPPRKRERDECVKIGSRWVHLRTCLECGGTHCCDNSPGQRGPIRRFNHGDTECTAIFSLSSVCSVVAFLQLAIRVAVSDPRQSSRI